MKKIFTLFCILPLWIFGQSPLVKWYKADLTPTYEQTNLTASLTGVTNLEWGHENVFYTTDGNFSSTSGLNPQKYIQFTLAPDAGYKINLRSLAFSARSQGGEQQKLQIRYSKKSDFSEDAELLSETVITAAYKTFDLKFPTAMTVLAGEKLYVRLYVYNTYNNFHLEHNNSGTKGPVFTGSTDVMVPVAPVAVDDRVATGINKSVTIDILGNDTPTSSLASINVANPAKGTVKVNGLANVTYTPPTGFTGYDSFYYSLTNAVGVSNTAKVEVQVIDGVEKVISRWNKDDFSAVNYMDGVSGAAIFVAPNTAIANFDNHWMEGTSYNSYELKGFPIGSELNGNLDETRYFQFILQSALQQEMVMLNKFAMQFAGHSTGAFTIKYSKDPAFKKDIGTLVTRRDFQDTAYKSWQELSADFPNGTTILPNEKLYVRIYVYNLGYSSAGFYIKKSNNSAPAELYGPTISAFKSVIYPEPCAQTVTWSAAGWSGEPTLDKKVIIEADYDTAELGRFEACSITVRNGNLIIGEDTAITVENEITVQPGSQIIVKSGGNLVQTNDSAVNTGSITVERYTQLKRLDYAYWASPVAGQKLKSFSPGTLDNRFYTYNEATDLFEVINPNTHVFGNNVSGFESAAKGYAIRAYNNYPAASGSNPAPLQDFNGKFVGVPNNGEIKFDLKFQSGAKQAGNGYNLVGNPYPSNISYNALLKANRKVLTGSAYFWTNLNPNPAMQGSGYPGTGVYNNYAVLNRVGGIPATMGSNPAEKVQPKRTIAVGQGFIVKAAKAGSLVFKNSIRTSESNSSFVNKNQEADDRFWLHMKTPLGVVTTTLIGYVEEATNGYEEMYDATLLTVGSDALFTEVEGQKLGIQGRAWPVAENDVVALGTSHYEAGTYTIYLGEHEGVFAQVQDIFLKDKQTGTVTNLSKEAYTFTADAGITSGRFEILYRKPQVLGTTDQAGGEILVYRSGETFVVHSAKSKLQTVELFDASGRLLQKFTPRATELQIDASDLSSGLYLLNLATESGHVQKKMIK